jgi:Ser/Thr protein kinase RdoA (MazF antagonist)
MSTTATAHGMDKTRVEPDWPPLGLAEVRALLRRFPGCGEPIEILSVSPRPFSAASVVSTCSGRVFIKRHHSNVRDREGLLEEHRFLQHLLAHGAPVPRVYATETGETTVEIGEWTYEVHEAPAGVDIYEDALSWTPFLSAAHAYSAGQALARLHRAAEGFMEPVRKPRPLVASFTIFAHENPEAELERYLKARPALAGDASTRRACEDALELLTPFHAELMPLLPALDPLWTHNDLHASNLLWTDASDHARATLIIDFGLADRTNAVHDLAQTIERNIVEWLELHEGSEDTDDVPVHLDHLYALLEGYETVRSLSAAEAVALAPMTALCHAEFALTEADYFHGVLRSDANTRVCTEGYLVGHARWFCGPGGTILLNAIRRWSEMRASRAQSVLSGKVGQR